MLVRSKIKRVVTLLICTLLLGAIGTYYVVASKAAVTTSATEAEQSQLIGCASSVADNSASMNAAIKFQTCTSAVTKPTTQTVGVPAGTTLNNSGSITVTTAGTTISNVHVTGTISVKANNVTIQNCKIKMTGYFGLRIDAGRTGITIKNCEIYTDNGGYTGVAGGNFTMRDSYIHGFENPVTLLDGNATVEHNVIDRLQGDSAGAHYDGLEVYSGSNHRIAYNDIKMTDVSGAWMGDTGAINITPTWSNIDNVVVTGNWIGGGSFTLNLDEQNGYKLNNLTVTNNRWYGSAPSGYAAFGPIRLPQLITTRSGNVWDASGQTI